MKQGGAKLPCAHCGTPVEAEHEPAFCCTGCATVHAALADAGLSSFYALRARLGDVGGPTATSVQAGSFRHFDDPAFLERFAHGDRIELAVEGVHCAACVWVVEQLPRIVPGVTQARLDFGRARVHLQWDQDQVPLSAIAEELAKLGYPPRPVGAAGEAARRRADRRALIRLGISAALAGNAMLLAFALYSGADRDAMFSRPFEWLSLLLAIPAVTYGAWPFYRAAWAGLRVRVLHLDLPIAIGLLAGFFYSVFETIRGGGEVWYDTVTLLVFLLLAGRYAQQRGQQAAMNRAELLAALTPGRATRWRDSDWESVAASSLQSGDRVRVRSGESLPGDGEVVAGEGHIDQRLLTGEARPVPVLPGGHVFAGTVNLGNPIEVRLTAVGGDTRVGHLMARAGAEDQERAPLVALADRLTGWFVAIVLGLALLGGIAWWFVDPSQALGVAVALLVVTCPCALGLATPVALAVARGQAARAGILFRSTAAIERLATIDRVCFDKTGTLTEGRLAVVGAALTPEQTRWVGAVASASVHPVSRALAAWAGSTLQPTEVKEIPGTGITGVVDGHTIEIGSPLRLAGAQAFHTDQHTATTAGHTPVLIRIDGQAVALVAVGDRIRPESAPAIAALQAAGVQVEILSGDHPDAVAAVARQLGVSIAHGGATPEDKARSVATGLTAMVGDGLNDAAALRAARVGLAVHGGAEVALQVADAFLTRAAPALVVEAREGARRALSVVRRGLAFSLIYNAIFASLALAGLISPLVAAVLMPLSGLTVVGHAVMSRSFRAPVKHTRPVSAVGEAAPVG